MSPPARSSALAVVVGLPGAGKSTMLARVASGGPRPRPRVLDPDPLRRRFARRFPRLPYSAYRGLIHLLHGVRLLRQVVAGPRASGDTLFVHATTRRSRRVALARLAAACGWRPVLVVLDVPAARARGGQNRRGRVLGATGFARHVSRWERDRQALVPFDGAACAPWASVHIVGRGTTPERIRALVASPVTRAPGRLGTWPPRRTGAVVAG